MEKLEFECKTLSPLDGRYGKIKDALGDYFSEYALVKYRVFVEIQWLKYLIEHVDTPVLNDAKARDLSGVAKISSEFNYDSYKRIKEIEATTRHDVKAVEYFIDEKLKELGFEHLESFVHIGCTSEDINNTSYGCMIRDGLKNVWLPAATEFAKTIDGLAIKDAHLPMLAHTHGQPAT
ncbi:lyase family protein, partial [Intestinibaculum porci]